MLNSFLLKKGKPLETDISRPEMFQALSDKEALLWVDLEDPTEFESDCLVELFNFHELTVEDCLTDYSVPKIDDYEDYLFLVTHALVLRQDQEKQSEVLGTIELDTFVGPNYVVTFHKEPMKSVTAVREALKKKPQHYLGQGTDFLLHAILDQLVDHTEPLLTYYDEKLDSLEEEVCNHPRNDFLNTLMQVKKDIFNLRRAIPPQRDLLNQIARQPTNLVRKKNIVYFRDVYDHLLRIYGIAEGFHESITNILQVYFTYSNHRLNEIMKRMTVMATLSMPTIMIASIYGMNFEKMPELDWHFGYPLSILLMAVTSLAMLGWMKLRKWI